DYDRSYQRTREKRDGLGVEHKFSGYQRLDSATILDRFKIQYRFGKDRLFITDPTGGESEIDFSDNGVIVRRVSNGSDRLAQYDSAGRCLFKSLARRNDAEGFWTRVYLYSGEGYLLEAQDNLNGSTHYEYEGGYRLRAMRREGKTEEFQYDAADNLLKQPG